MWWRLNDSISLLRSWASWLGIHYKYSAPTELPSGAQAVRFDNQWMIHQCTRSLTNKANARSCVFRGSLCLPVNLSMGTLPRESVPCLDRSLTHQSHWLRVKIRKDLIHVAVSQKACEHFRQHRTIIDKNLETTGADRIE